MAKKNYGQAQNTAELPQEVVEKIAAQGSIVFIKGGSLARD